jgi:hypothetical protein
MEYLGCKIEDCENQREKESDIFCKSCFHKHILPLPSRIGDGEVFKIKDCASHWFFRNNKFHCSKCGEERYELLSSFSEVSEDGELIWNQNNVDCIYCRIFNAGESLDEDEKTVCVCANCLYYGDCGCAFTTHIYYKISPEKRLKAKLDLIAFLKRQERKIYEKQILEFLTCKKFTELSYVKEVPRDIIKIIVEKVKN